MKDILDFLLLNKVFYLATTNENRNPHVRPMAFVMEHEGKLAFCTSNQKDMYKQMIANPNVEICCMNLDCNTLRICGQVVFCTSPQTQQKVLDTMPDLQKMYSVGDGKLEVFCLTNAKAMLQDMTGHKQFLVI